MWGLVLLLKSCLLYAKSFQSHTNSLEDHGRQLAKNISDVASKLGGAKASGMLKNMMSSATSATFSETCSFLGAEPDIWSHLHSSSCLTGIGSLCFFSCLRLGLFLPNLQHRCQKLLKVFLSHPSPMARDWNWKVLVAHPEGVLLIYPPSGSPPYIPTLRESPLATSKVSHQTCTSSFAGTLMCFFFIFLWYLFYQIKVRSLSPFSPCKKSPTH